MRKRAIAAVAVALGAIGSPALAGPGQCYDAYGRPMGPVYDTDYPDYNLINAAVARGGRCTGVAATYTSPGFYGRDLAKYEYDAWRDRAKYRRDAERGRARYEHDADYRYRAYR